MKKIKDAVCVVGKKADGKNRYQNVGALFERDDGSQALKLDAVPVQFDGWINFYEPREQQGQPQHTATPQTTAAPDDDIPF